MAELLTKDQRKGLMYGSLISAGLAALAASRYGGNVLDAAGAGMAGATSGYAGGLDEIVKLRHAEIERQKTEELIRASQESQGLQKEKFMWEKKHGEINQLLHAAPILKEMRLGEQGDREHQALQEWIAQQKARGLSGFEQPTGPTETPALPPEMLELLGVVPRAQAGSAITEIIKSKVKPTKATKSQMIYDAQGNLIEWTPGTPIPAGAKLPSQSGMTYIDVGGKIEQRTKTGEKTGEITKTITPGTKATIESREKGAEEKPGAKLESETWINMKTHEQVRVSPRDQTKKSQLMGDVDWAPLTEALKLDPMLKWKILQRRPKDVTQKPTAGETKGSKFSIIKVEELRK